jgi:hypothetical protein
MSAESEPTWRCPAGRGELSDDGQRYRITWHQGNATKIALFRIVTADKVCVLQHIRSLYSSVRHGASCEVDDDVELEEIPQPFLAQMEREGYQPVVGGSAYA